MASDSFDTALRRIAECCGDLAGETTWYRFGSTTKDLGGRGRDLDLLIVYEHRSPERANELREAIAGCEPPEPLDVLLLMPEEAAKFNFVEAEGCQRIWP